MRMIRPEVGNIPRCARSHGKVTHTLVSKRINASLLLTARFCFVRLLGMKSSLLSSTLGYAIVIVSHLGRLGLFVMATRPRAAARRHDPKSQIVHNDKTRVEPGSLTSGVASALPSLSDSQDTSKLVKNDRDRGSTRPVQIATACSPASTASR